MITVVQRNLIGIMLTPQGSQDPCTLQLGAEAIRSRRDSRAG